MDKEQARFILQSFRPDGADSADSDFADALAVAIADRELSEWLANERAFDASFSKALSSVHLPETLRNDILGCIAAERGGTPGPQDELDHVLIQSFATIQAPDPLRARILAAMDQTMRPPATRRPVWYRFALPLAAAAGVALAFWLKPGENSAESLASQKLPLDVVQANFIRQFENPDFTLDAKREDHRQLLDMLKSRNLPCPCKLPHGLNKVKGIGCRELVINGKRGSIICFDERKNGPVHLVIFRREDVEGEIPCETPHLEQHGRWASACWEYHDNVMLLIAATNKETLASLF